MCRRFESCRGHEGIEVSQPKSQCDVAEVWQADLSCEDSTCFINRLTESLHVLVVEMAISIESHTCISVAHAFSQIP